MTRSPQPMLRTTIPRKARTLSSRRGKVSGANTALAVTALAIALSYVFLVNDVSTKGYEIQSLKRSGSVVSGELAKAKRQASSDQSMLSISDRLLKHTFIPEGSVEYAHPGSPVALGDRTQ